MAKIYSQKNLFPGGDFSPFWGSIKQGGIIIESQQVRGDQEVKGIPYDQHLVICNLILKMPPWG